MNTLKDKDFALLTKLAESATDKSLNSGEVKKAYTTGFDEAKKAILANLLKPYLEPNIGDFKIHIAMLLEEFQPWTVHTDYVKGDERPGFAVLIPLETIPTATVIFNEHCLDDFDIFKNTNDPLENNCDYLHDSLLSHCKKDSLRYVSLKAIEGWEKGKLIIWDRRELHSSDNFLQNGIDSKRAIVIFTSKVD